MELVGCLAVEVVCFLIRYCCGCLLPCMSRAICLDYTHCSYSYRNQTGHCLLQRLSCYSGWIGYYGQDSSLDSLGGLCLPSDYSPPFLCNIRAHCACAVRFLCYIS